MGGPFYFSIIGRIGSRDRENRCKRGSRRFVRAERTACGYGYTDGVPGYGLGLLPYYFGQQPATQQVAGIGRGRMVEQLSVDTQFRSSGDIGRAVIDKERF